MDSDIHRLLLTAKCLREEIRGNKQSFALLKEIEGITEQLLSEANVISKGDLVKASSEHKVVNDYVMFILNTSPVRLAEIILEEDWDDMEDHRKQYAQKYINMYKNSPIRIWTMIDTDNQEKLIEAMREKYG